MLIVSIINYKKVKCNYFLYFVIHILLIYLNYGELGGKISVIIA